MNKDIDFVNADVKRTLFFMYMPMLIGAFLNISYSLIDSLWIGNLLGKNEMAALSNSTPIVFLMTAIGMGATNGVSIILSKAVGEGNKKNINTIIVTSAVYAVIISIGVTLLLEVLLNYYLKLMNTPESIYQLAYDYMSIYIIGYMAVYMYFYFTAVLRSYGNTTFQAISLLICTIMNAVLDPLFINKMGLKGAAVATLISQSMAIIFMVIYIIYKKMFDFNLSNFRFSCVMDLTIKGVPSAIQQSIPSISTSVLTSLVNVFGITAAASYGIAGKIETMMFAPTMVLNMVLTSITGFCFGASRNDKAKEYLKCAKKYGYIVMSLLAGTIVIFSKQLSIMFLSNSDVAQIVFEYFLIIGIGYILYVGTSCYQSIVNGCGKPGLNLVLMIFYYLIIRIPLAYILCNSSLELYGIWIAVLISHCVAVCIAKYFSAKCFKSAT